MDKQWRMRWTKRVTQTRVWRSIFRHGYPDNDLDRMNTMVTNFFLHLLPAKVNKHSLKPTYTWGLGFISFYLFIILTITGVLLMFFYVPSVDRAYRDMKDLEFVVSYGMILRNMHRWAAHGMVAFVFLHMVRVFYTGSYKPPREFNWGIGVVLWVLTLLLSFTGYLLPWDQLAFWAITVGTSIASYPPWTGDTIRFLLLGGNTVGQGALLRFYVLHVVFLPIAAGALLALHFWRVRKDGGLSRSLPSPLPMAGGSPPGGPTTIEVFPPDTRKTYGLMMLVRGTSPTVEYQAPEEELPSWPHLVFRLLLLFQGVSIAMMALAFFLDAPLEELANPVHSPNPAKAPWYFLGLQELVSYSALIGGVIVPGLLILGLMSIPYIDYGKEGEGVWFTSPLGKKLTLGFFLGTLVLTPVLTYLNAKFGIRVWYPEASQLLVDLFNPASILLAFMAASSLITWFLTGSRRMGAISLFSSFVAGYMVYTVMGTYFRGPNWVWVWPW